MVNKNIPNVLQFDYLLKELSDLLTNKPESAHRLIENLLNIDYDIEDKSGLYKILNEEQRKFLHLIYIRRKQDPKFNLKFNYVLMLTAGMVGLSYGVIKLVENLNE